MTEDEMLDKDYEAAYNNGVKDERECVLGILDGVYNAWVTMANEQYASTPRLEYAYRMAVRSVEQAIYLVKYKHSPKPKPIPDGLKTVTIDGKEYQVEDSFAENLEDFIGWMGEIAERKKAK